MNNKERAKVVFEAISKIVGFEIKPNKDFYIWVNGEKIKYHIRSDLTLIREISKGIYERSIFTILPIFNGGYQLEEIKEPLVTDEERDFLRHFKFDKLKISEISNDLNLFDKNWQIVVSFDLNSIDFNFDGLKNGKRYSKTELGL